MRTRVLSALVLLPIILLAVLLGNPFWAVLMAAAAAQATREQYGLAAAGGMRPDRWLGLAAAAGLALSGLWPEADLARPIVAAAVIAAYAAQLARAKDDRSMADWMATVAFPVGVGILTSYIVLLRQLPDGLAWTLVLLVFVWVNDSAAYLGGRAFGRRPFFASVSPKKTLEGFAAGAIAAMALGLLLPAAGVLGPQALASLGEIPPVAFAALGLVVSVVAPAGDLSQSFLKRQVGAKDFSDLIPGHGGVLDRVDSLLFAAPFVYYAALWLGGG